VLSRSRVEASGFSFPTCFQPPEATREFVVQITQIEDLSHELLRDYRDLTDVELRSTREPLEGLYIAESLKILERALRAGHRPRSILSTAQWLPKLEELASHLGDILEKTPVFIG
jgi:hypothetical protein